MSKFIIEGGQALCGEVTVSGNKNAALKLLPACLLTDEPVILHNIPAIRDVQNTMLVLRDLGVDVVELGGGSWRIHARNVDKAELDPELAARTRASFVFAGPMLARVGRVVLLIPGGDVIGGRPLDTHVQALTALGASVSMSQRGVFEMAAPRLRGAGHLLLAEASVTATENAVMAAVLAKGNTIIDNAACEPHVRDLCDFLNSMGGQIEGIGSNRLTIRGVDKLHGTEFRIGSDFMEVGSFIGAAAVTGGEVRIRDAQPRFHVAVVDIQRGVHSSAAQSQRPVSGQRTGLHIARSSRSGRQIHHHAGGGGARTADVEIRRGNVSAAHHQLRAVVIDVSDAIAIDNVLEKIRRAAIEIDGRSDARLAAQIDRPRGHRT